jgi:hypothetical protein
VGLPTWNYFYDNITFYYIALYTENCIQKSIIYKKAAIYYDSIAYLRGIVFEKLLEQTAS